jgi:hypothetical protein
MKKLIVILFSLFILSAQAQLAVINDPDGFVNVRETGTIKSKIVGRLNTGDIFLYDDEDNNKAWRNIYYSPEKNMLFSPIDGKATSLKPGYITGFVHLGGVTPIETLSKMKYKKSFGYIGTNDTITFTIKIRPFISKRHKIKTSKDGCVNCNENFLDRIDGKKPWGVDGNLPKKEIYSILLFIDRKPIIIPLESYNDLFEAHPENFNVYYDNQRNIYLYMPNNSDGAGGYDVVWVIKDDKLVRRYIDSID